MKYDFEYIESFLSDGNWYWGLVILGMILIVIGYIYYQSYNYQDENGESSWKIFKNSDGFKTKVGIAAALGFLVAAELFVRIYSKFEKGRYKVLLREIHQMVATDATRKTDEVGKLPLYKQLAKDRSETRRFLDPIKYQQSDSLQPLGIMKLNAMYTND